MCIRDSGDTAQIGVQLHQLATGHAVFEGKLAGQITNIPANLDAAGDDVLAEDRGAAAGRAHKAEQGAHGGRFASAVRSEETEDIPLVDREVDMVDTAVGAVGLREVVCLDCWSGHNESLSFRGFQFSRNSPSAAS